MLWLVPTLTLVLLILACAFFSSGELALMMLDPLKLETAARRGNRLAVLQKRMRGTPQRILSTILLGNNLVNITFATIGTTITIKHLAPVSGIGEERALVISTILMTVLLVMFGELLPKTLAAIAPTRLAAIVTYPLFLIDWLLTPFNWLISAVMMPIVRLITGGRTIRQHTASIEDIGTALTLAYASGTLHRTDADVAHEALTFSRKNLGDVMTPRVDIVALPESSTAGAALALMTESGFSRLPIYLSGLDEITGVLMFKDLVRSNLRETHGGSEAGPQWEDRPCAPLARRPALFPATKSIVETLAEMRQLRVHLALVIDEHGGTAGLVSLEDIIEELVGDIRDETDADNSADVVSRGAGFAIVTGRARIESLPELSQIVLGDSEAVTVGGLMMERLGRPAVVGDEISVGAIKVTALKVLGNQIKLMRITQAEHESHAGQPVSDQD